MPNISDVMVALADCLREQMEADSLPDPCFLGVIPGDGAIQDYAGDCGERCGMAWVRLTTSYPANQPGVIVQTPGNCDTALGFEVEIGVTRCTDVTEGPRDASLMLADFDQQMADMNAIRRAILCCSTLQRDDYILGQYRPLGPQGGVYGGAWSLMLSLL